MQNPKKNILFIQTQQSRFDYKTPLFTSAFETVTFAADDQKALKLIYNKSYDLIVKDMSFDVEEGITFVKQIKELKSDSQIYTLVETNDEDKIGGLIDAGIHTFVLTPEQFEQALETLATL